MRTEQDSGSSRWSCRSKTVQPVGPPVASCIVSGSCCPSRGCTFRAGETNRARPGRTQQVKPQVYKDPRPAEHFTRFHERVRKGPADAMYKLVRVVLTPYLLIFYRGRVMDTDKIPTQGPTTIVPNHFSFLYHFFVAAFNGREFNFMAKSHLFKPPLQSVNTPGGVFPVLRGRR